MLATFYIKKVLFYPESENLYYEYSVFDNFLVYHCNEKIHIVYTVYVIVGHVQSI